MVDAPCPQPTSATRAGLEFRLDPVERWNPFGDQVAHIAGPEKPLGAAEKTGVVLMPADSLSAAEGVEDGRLVANHRQGDLYSAQKIEGAVFITESGGLLGVHGKARGGGVVIDETRGRLRGEPFANVSLMRAGRRSEIGGRHRIAFGERFIQTQFFADKHRADAHHRAEIADQLTHESHQFVRLRCHSVSSF